MVGIIVLILLLLVVVGTLVWSVKHDFTKNRETREHERNMANPYRVIKNGLGKLAIQNYTFVKKGDGDDGEWRWQTVADGFTSQAAVKNAYCELMAKFKFESESVMLKEAEKMKNSKSYLKSIEVHDILDMSDCVDLCNAIIEKMRAEKDGNEQEEKPKKRTRKKVKDESESGEN